MGGACEILDETCGVLIPKGETDMLVASLRRLIQDQTLRTRLGTAGQERARQLSDPKTQMNKLHQTLKGMIQARNSKQNG